MEKYMNGSICGGTKCSKRNECKKYNMPPGEYYYVDWSTNGWGTYSDDKIECGWDCGDLSDGYPLFEEMIAIDIENDMIINLDENEVRHIIAKYVRDKGYECKSSDVRILVGLFSGSNLENTEKAIFKGCNVRIAK